MLCGGMVAVRQGVTWGLSTEDNSRRDAMMELCGAVEPKLLYIMKYHPANH